MEWKKQKKNSISLPRAITKALGKEGSFAEGPSNSPRQRFFWKNPENFFAEGQGAGPRQRF